MIETFRPGVVERLGLGYDDLAADNPRLVFASVTAFGRTGRYAGVRGYDGVMMAQLGGLDLMAIGHRAAGPCVLRDAVGLVERGPDRAARDPRRAVRARVERARATGRHDDDAGATPRHDPWNSLICHIVAQYPGAYSSARLAEPGSDTPSNPLFFRLLVALTKDGRWLQFSQTTDRLFRAFMRVLELDWMFDDPEWKDVPDFDDEEQAARR